MLQTVLELVRKFGEQRDGGLVAPAGVEELILQYLGDVVVREAASPSDPRFGFARSRRPWL
jgi:hypothetical protein